MAFPPLTITTSWTEAFVNAELQRENNFQYHSESIIYTLFWCPFSVFKLLQGFWRQITELLKCDTVDSKRVYLQQTSPTDVIQLLSLKNSVPEYP